VNAFLIDQLIAVWNKLVSVGKHFIK